MSKQLKRQRRRYRKESRDLLLGHAKRKRTCSACGGSIPKQTTHLAMRYQDVWGMKRFNVCFFCAEVLMKKIKKSFKKPLKTIRKERQLENLIDDM